MRHGHGHRKLSKPTDQRIALIRSLAEALLTHQKIETTDVRAKEAKKFAEKIITLGKKGDLASRRQALKLLPNKDVIKSVFSTIAKKYEHRPGGYTRLIKVGFRRGDGAPVSILELV